MVQLLQLPKFKIQISAIKEFSSSLLYFVFICYSEALRVFGCEILL